MISVFLAFAPEDLDLVKRLIPLISYPDSELSYCQINKEIDFESSEGLLIRQEIGGKIVKSKITLCLIGETSHKSKWVDAALEKSRHKGNKIIAMALKGTKVALLPQVIREENLTFYPWDPKRLDRLIKEGIH